jgi:MinD-like ATPase involved in chromosome partitioning or flagellar assembly
MSATGQITELELEHPRGRLRVNVPADVAIAELIGDFLDVAELPDSDGWTLQLTDGRQCSDELTLAQVGMPRTVVLYDSAKAPPQVAVRSDAGRTADTCATAAPQATQTTASRPVRARAEQLLPDRLSTLARIRDALAAVGSTRDARDAQTLGVNDPDMFTKVAKRPVRTRVRDAWWGTDYLRLLEASVLTPHPRSCQTIAVASPKGGVGKTVITALLGSLISFIRRDRVVAVDTNPDWGSLGRRLVPDHRVYIDDLLAGPLAAQRTSAMDLAVHLGHGPDGLLVAPAPSEQERARRLDEAAYRTLFARLAELAEVLVLDCGTGLDSPAARAALAVANQVVLVTDGQPDTASLVAEAACEQLRVLEQPLFLVANMITPRSRVDLGALERKVGFAKGVVDMPHDQTGADSLQRSRFSWQRQAPEQWRIPMRELSALIANEWGSAERRDHLTGEPL